MIINRDVYRNYFHLRIDHLCKVKSVLFQTKNKWSIIALYRRKKVWGGISNYGTILYYTICIIMLRREATELPERVLQAACCLSHPISIQRRTCTMFPRYGWSQSGMRSATTSRATLLVRNPERDCSKNQSARRWQRGKWHPRTPPIDR